MIIEQKTALILLAGGDGSRLNCADPKLIYPLKLHEAKSFTELFIKRVLSLTSKLKIPQEKQPIIYLIIQSQMAE